MAESLEQAYELNQKKRNCIIGGMLWLKMGNRMVPTAIDLSNLGLNTIEENEEEFSIGCMTTLRQLEQHEGLNSYTNGAVSESVRSIVGVQFRNLATVGGSIFGRFGFSDVLTCGISLRDGQIYTAVGARPSRAVCLCVSEADWKKKGSEALAGELAAQFPTEGNMRAGKEFRSHLAEVLIGRGLKQIEKIQEV